MTLQAQNGFSIPEETARVARAAYPKGTIDLKMRDALRDHLSRSILCPFVPAEWTPR